VPLLPTPPTAPAPSPVLGGPYSSYRPTGPSYQPNHTPSGGPPPAKVCTLSATEVPRFYCNLLMGCLGLVVDSGPTSGSTPHNPPTSRHDRRTPRRIDQSTPRPRHTRDPRPTRPLCHLRIRGPASLLATAPMAQRLFPCWGAARLLRSAHLTRRPVQQSRHRPTATTPSSRRWEAAKSGRTSRCRAARRHPRHTASSPTRPPKRASSPTPRPTRASRPTRPAGPATDPATPSLLLRYFSFYVVEWEWMARGMAWRGEEGGRKRGWAGMCAQCVEK
jgi:hypothetical protein